MFERSKFTSLFQGMVQMVLIGKFLCFKWSKFASFYIVWAKIARKQQMRGSMRGYPRIFLRNPVRPITAAERFPLKNAERQRSCTEHQRSLPACDWSDWMTHFGICETPQKAWKHCTMALAHLFPGYSRSYDTIAAEFRCLKLMTHCESCVDDFNTKVPQVAPGTLCF